MGIAGIAAAPEWALEKEQAKELGDAIAGVLAFYNVKMTPKQEAAAILFEVAAKIYPPMILTTYLRLKIEADKRKKSTPSQRPQAPAQPTPPPSAPASRATVMPPGFDPGNIKLDS